MKRLRLQRIAARELSHITGSLAKEGLYNHIGTENSALKEPEKPTVNEVGIQYLSRTLQKKLFPTAKSPTESKKTSLELRKIRLSQQYLNQFGLLNKTTNITTPISFPIPKTLGKNLNEHFIRMALADSRHYLNFAEVLSEVSLPERPRRWLFKPGWYRYEPGCEPVRVDYPQDDILVFDVETMYMQSPYSVLATCASPTAWYGWVSPYLTSDDPTIQNNHLIPMNTQSARKLIVGHNIAYDRARIMDEYSFNRTKAFYLDTLSLHAAISGICSRQRPLWSKYNENLRIEKQLSKDLPKLMDMNYDQYLMNGEIQAISEKVIEKFDSEALPEDNPWTSLTSTNSLADVYRLYCGSELSKDDRNHFKTTDKLEIVSQFQLLMDYCARDVSATHKVFCEVFPRFRKTCPHPVSFSALRHINTVFLPTSKKTWQGYIESAETLYQNNRVKIEKQLAQMAADLVELHKKDPETVENDPWYGQLNWTIAPVKLTKSGVPYRRQKMPGFPEWYKSLFPTSTGGIKLSIRTRIVPILLKLKWEGLPLVWTESRGWCFRVEGNKFSLINEMQKKNYIRIDDFTKDPNFEELTRDYKYVYFKVPHPNGPGNRTVSLTSKSYLKYLESGIMTSEYPLAQNVLELNSAASYWISSRERIMSQFVVYDGALDFGLPALSKGPEDDPVGIIIPQILPMGTITRRAVEKTWLTASNVKKNRIGSELKTKIEAPSGYCFVGADVDSEELWIASLLSDSVFGIHGGSAIGWMTLEGNKLEKTDLHLKTAAILGISRNEAKIFNYSRIYGAGLKHTLTLLKQFNPVLSEKEVVQICNNLFDSTKGKTYKLSAKEKRFLSQKGVHLSKIWYGGLESVLFNRLENLAESDSPKTPVLRAGITEALKKLNLSANSFLPSRINWAIQSSGVDYLHLLITLMEYLIDRYQVDARLCITVHDEIRYLCKEHDKYKTALLLQIANVWTRGLFCEQLGVPDIPQSCAFFSQVDIDKILRKEVDTPCYTPSNPDADIPDGESLDVVSLMEKIGSLDWLNAPETVKENLNISMALAALGEKEDTNGSGNHLSSAQEASFVALQVEQDKYKVQKLLQKIVGLK